VHRNLFAIANLDLEHLPSARHVLEFVYHSELPEPEQRELTIGGRLFRMCKRPKQKKKTVTQSWQPVGLRMMRLQRCQGAEISAVQISPLSPYIFPICVSKSSKSVLAFPSFRYRTPKSDRLLEPIVTAKRPDYKSSGRNICSPQNVVGKCLVQRRIISAMYSTTVVMRLQRVRAAHMKEAIIAQPCCVSVAGEDRL